MLKALYISMQQLRNLKAVNLELTCNKTLPHDTFFYNKIQKNSYSFVDLTSSLYLTHITRVPASSLFSMSDNCGAEFRSFT